MVRASAQGCLDSMGQVQGIRYFAMEIRHRARPRWVVVWACPGGMEVMPSSWNVAPPGHAKKTKLRLRVGNSRNVTTAICKNHGLCKAKADWHCAK
jgi:hypothetical protein